MFIMKFCIKSAVFENETKFGMVFVVIKMCQVGDT